MKTTSDLLHAGKPAKTIETMFRVTASNSQKLSDQADAKANLLITVNSIIASVLVTFIANKIGANFKLMVPLTMLLMVNIITIACSIFATRPVIPKGIFTSNELASRKTNLLFFGNFYRMQFDDYCGGMLQVMNNKDYLYRSMLKDVYCQGVALGRKYRLLRIAYNIFLSGMTLSIAVFCLVMYA